MPFCQAYSLLLSSIDLDDADQKLNHSCVCLGCANTKVTDYGCQALTAGIAYARAALVHGLTPTAMPHVAPSALPRRRLGVASGGAGCGVVAGVSERLEALRTWQRSVVVQRPGAQKRCGTHYCFSTRNPGLFSCCAICKPLFSSISRFKNYNYNNIEF